jgi:hypothetical protein
VGYSADEGLGFVKNIYIYIYVCVLGGISIIILFTVLHIFSTYKPVQAFKVRHIKNTLCRKNFDLLMALNIVTTGIRNIKMVK